MNSIKLYWFAWLILASVLLLGLVKAVSDHTDELQETLGFFSRLKWAPLFASGIIGLIGALPLLIIPLDGRFDGDQKNSDTLRIMLGFAGGGLLSNVFLHIIPEANQRVVEQGGSHFDQVFANLWIVMGIIVFLTMEKVVGLLEKSDESGSVNAAGYLNLVVNTLDNFTHGLGVAAAFSINYRVGVLSTIAIIIHEIPHEIGDFAILIKSGFSKRRAIMLQLITSVSGIIGTAFGLTMEGVGQATTWMLPFTAGGFIYIALVSLIPDLLENQKGWSWFRDVLHILGGMTLVGFVTNINE